MASNINNATRLMDEIRELETIRNSKLRRYNLSSLHNTIVARKCHLLETSIPMEIPIPLFMQLANFKWFYHVLGMDDTRLDTCLKRGFENALVRLNMRDAEDRQLSTVQRFELLDVCARLLELETEDEGWSNLESFYKGSLARLGHTAGID